MGKFEVIKIRDWAIRRNCLKIKINFLKYKILYLYSKNGMLLRIKYFKSIDEICLIFNIRIRI